MSDKKQTKTISFVSGKGGVGKTAITASVGKLLASIGYKVLLVDSDFFTHGLTFLLGFSNSRAGILELSFKHYRNIDASTIKSHYIAPRFVETEVVRKISDNLFFIQATSSPAIKYSELISSNIEKVKNLFEILMRTIKDSGEFDFVFIDSQAGSVPTTFSNVKASDKTILVIEPDPVAIYATQNAVSELGLSPSESYYIINKLSVEESSSYNAIENYFTMMNHLPPIPFDFEVRRSFMTRVIPINVDEPSAFMFGIMRMLSYLFPETRTQIKNLEKKTRNAILGPTEEKIRDAEKQLESLTEIKIKLQQKKERIFRSESRYSSLSGFLFPTMVVILSFFVTLNIVFEMKQDIILLSSSMAIAYFLAVYVLIQRKRKPYKSELDKVEINLALTEQQISMLRFDIESYKNLMISKTADLFLGQEKFKKNS